MKFKNLTNQIQTLIDISNTAGFKAGFYTAQCKICSTLKLWNRYKKVSFTRNYLIEKYLLNNVQKELIENVNKPNLSLNKTENKKPVTHIIWTMWAQGYENAPLVVKRSIDSMKKFSNGARVVVIDENNVGEYIELPQYIYEKYHEGKISQAHFSDIVRTALLYNYGGLWLDSTLRIIKPIPTEIYKYDFYSINWSNKRNYVASRDKWSVCLMGCAKNTELMKICYQSELKYWEKYNFAIIYLLLDCFIANAYDNVLRIKKEIDKIPINNNHIFDFVGDGVNLANKDLDKEMLSTIYDDTWCMKLSYKFDFKRYNGENLTNFGYIDNCGETCKKDK